MIFDKKITCFASKIVFFRGLRRILAPNLLFSFKVVILFREKQGRGCWFYEFGCVELRKWQSESTDIDSSLSLLVDYKGKLQ